jgi:UDP-glucose 4-epimerase
VKILVTGATGFVGRRVCAALIAENHDVVAVVRPSSDRSVLPAQVTVREVADLRRADWPSIAADADAVVWLAARVHVMHETEANPDAAFRALNVDAPLACLEQLPQLGAFVYMSSVKVNGEATPSDRAFTEADAPAPEDPYGRSKRDAEEALSRALVGRRTRLTVLRPPLVYGPGVGGNFRRMFDLVRFASRVPLPFGGLRNRRSLIFVDDLANVTARAVMRGGEQTRVYLVAGNDTPSTSELLAEVGRASGVRPLLVPVPGAVHAVARRMPKVGPALSRLTGSLVVDATRARRELDWQPVTNIRRGVEATAAWLRETSA